MQNRVCLEVGPGPSPKPGYIHCDASPRAFAEYVCNAWAVPFGRETVDEIYSRHMLEHLVYGDARRTLRHWYAILKVGGVIDISVPDIDAHIKQYSQAGNSLYSNTPVSNREHALAGFYGWQKSPFDVHKWGYSLKSLSDLLTEIGYTAIQKVDDNSVSGPLNLRIVAKKESPRLEIPLDKSSRGGMLWRYNCYMPIRKARRVFRRILSEMSGLFGKNYGLDSGERQTATSLVGIRHDHVERYQLALDLIIKNSSAVTAGADVFCGNGYGTNLLSKNLPSGVIDSIDGSEEAILCAKKHYQTPNVNFYHKLFPFDLKVGVYDWIVSLESVEHIEDGELFFEALSRSLKPNGLLVVSTPNSLKIDLRLNPNKFHYKHYADVEVEQIGAKNGLNLLSKYGQDTYQVNSEGRIVGLLQDSEMNLRKNYDGQFNVYVFRK